MSLVELKVPAIGESITEVTLSQWLVGNGEYVKLDEAICEFESDKATLELPSEAAGKLIWVAEEGDDLEIGAVVAKVDTSVTAGAETPAEAAPVVAETTAIPPPAATTSAAAGHPSPAAAKIMRENDLAADKVSGTGRGGRITKEDAVKAAANKPAAPAPKAAATAATAAPTPIISVGNVNYF